MEQIKRYIEQQNEVILYYETVKGRTKNSRGRFRCQKKFFNIRTTRTNNQRYFTRKETYHFNYE